MTHGCMNKMYRKTLVEEDRILVNIFAKHGV